MTTIRLHIPTTQHIDTSWLPANVVLVVTHGPQGLYYAGPAQYFARLTKGILE